MKSIIIGICHLIFICSIVVLTTVSGSIKEVGIDDNKMQPVTLKMGKSTVLRFEEKPHKIVVGNQNYLNIEYVANDVTIQPLGFVTTNIFIYTKTRTYGFIVTVTDTGDYNDLVKVFWKRSSARIAKHSKISLVLDKGIQGTVDNPKLLKDRGWFADILLFNFESTPLETDRIVVSMVDENKNAVPVKVIFGEEKIESNGVGRLRVFFGGEKGSFVVHLKLNKKPMVP